MVEISIFSKKPASELRADYGSADYDNYVIVLPLLVFPCQMIQCGRGSSSIKLLHTKQ